MVWKVAGYASILLRSPLRPLSLEIASCFSYSFARSTEETKNNDRLLPAKLCHLRSTCPARGACVCVCVCDRTITGHTPSRCLHLFLLVFCVFEVVGTLAFFGLFLLCFILATKRANFSAHLRAMKELRICLKTIGVPSARASATSGCPVCTARSVESM